MLVLRLLYYSLKSVIGPLSIAVVGVSFRLLSFTHFVFRFTERYRFEIHIEILTSSSVALTEVCSIIFIVNDAGYHLQWTDFLLALRSLTSSGGEPMRARAEVGRWSVLSELTCLRPSLRR